MFEKITELLTKLNQLFIFDIKKSSSSFWKECLIYAFILLIFIIIYTFFIHKPVTNFLKQKQNDYTANNLLKKQKNLLMKKNKNPEITSYDQEKKSRDKMNAEMKQIRNSVLKQAEEEKNNMLKQVQKEINIRNKKNKETFEYRLKNVQNQIKIQAQEIITIVLKRKKKEKLTAEKIRKLIEKLVDDQIKY